MKKKVLHQSELTGIHGHMVKTKRQIKEDLKLIDVVIELRDARIPVSSQNPDMKELIKNKKQIIVLNKSDLANEKETLKWIKYFKDNGLFAISVDSNLGKDINNVTKEIEKLMKDEKIQQEQKGRILGLKKGRSQERICAKIGI